MMYQDVHIHGGVVESVQTAGDVIIHGGVVERLTAHGDCKQYGGIVEQNIIQTGANANYQEPKVIYRDREKIVYRDRVVTKYRTRMETQKTIDDLQRLIERERRRADDLEARNVTLQEELLRKENQQSDNVLVMRIESLENQLKKEREARKKDVEDLQYNLDGVKEAYFDLLHQKKEQESKSQEIADKHIDILATLMALYPFTTDNDLVFEFGIPVNRIRDTARVLGVMKSPEERKAAVEYLRKQHIEFIQRRGGDTTKGKKKTKTKKKK